MKKSIYISPEFEFLELDIHGIMQQETTWKNKDEEEVEDDDAKEWGGSLFDENVYDD